MPRYYVSRYIAIDASTLYEVQEDGSYWSISPQGHERYGSDPVPVDREIEAQRQAYGTAQSGTAKDQALKKLSEMPVEVVRRTPA